MPNSRAVSGLAVCSLLFGSLSSVASPAETVALADAAAAGGLICPQAEGAFIALLQPGHGSILLATKAFPGGQRAGLLEGDRLRFNLPGVGSRELRTESSHGGAVAIWGMVDRSLQVGNRSGCVSFGDRDFTSVDDLKTYLHWILRDVFFRLRSQDDAEPLALRLANRTVTLEVSAPGHLPARLRVPEAGTVGLQLPDSPGVYYFQPLILDEGSARLAVKVLQKEGGFFSDGVAREIAFVIAGREAPGATPTDPVLEIRCAGID